MDGSAGIVSNFMSKAGGAMGSFITGILLSLAGYIFAEGDAVVAQPASALCMIRIDYAIIPAILMAIIAACFFTFVKLEKMIPEWEAAQKAKKAAAEA